MKTQRLPKPGPPVFEMRSKLEPNVRYWVEWCPVMKCWAVVAQADAEGVCRKLAETGGVE